MNVDETLAAVAERERIVSLYLFGSVAERRDHSESDVDVGVLLDRSRFADERSRFEERVRLASVFGHELRRDADVVILNDAPPQLARAIITHGRRLFCADDEADHAFVRNALLLAADIDPFLARMRALVLESLERR